MADRLDSLVGLFAVGCAPTASADPFGLRRVAYGLLQVRGGGEGVAHTHIRGWGLCTHRIAEIQQ
jgi:hypothetical protein